MVFQIRHVRLELLDLREQPVLDQPPRIDQLLEFRSCLLLPGLDQVHDVDLLVARHLLQHLLRARVNRFQFEKLLLQLALHLHREIETGLAGEGAGSQPFRSFEPGPRHGFAGGNKSGRYVFAPGGLEVLGAEEAERFAFACRSAA